MNIIATIAFKSRFELLKVAEIISANIFNDIPFIGLEKKIYDEIPAVFLEHEIIGFKVILSGYPLQIESGFYNLTLYPNIEQELTDSIDIVIDDYIKAIFKAKLNKTDFELI